MPFRVLAYDGASYKSQITAGNKSILPVITFVLYFGKERWKGPRSLKAGLDIPKELEKYVSDYIINVFEIAWLSEEQIRRFKSDFRLVAEFFVKRRINPHYHSSSRTEIKHVEEMLKLLSAFTGDKRYESLLYNPETKEVNNMCEVADYLCNSGKAEMLYTLVQDGDLPIEKAAPRLNLTIEEFEKKMTEAGFMVPEAV